MAGGLGTRMRSSVPKHLHPILGRRMVDWVLEAARPLEPARTLVVASPATRDAFGEVEVAVQERALGTGDAIRSTRDALEGAVDEVLVLSGDTPLLTPELLARAPGDASPGGCRRDRPLVRARRAAFLRSDRPLLGRQRPRDRRGARRDTRGARAAGVQLVDLRLPGRPTVARARAARAAQRPGRALSHRCRARPGRARRARRGARCAPTLTRRRE